MVEPQALVGRSTEIPKTGLPSDTRSDDGAGRMVDILWTEGLRRLQPYHRQWYLNIAYLLGFQHLIWHPRNQRLYLPPMRRRQVRMVSNLIMSAFRINLSKLSGVETQIGIIPNSNEQEDMDAATFGRDLWQHIKRESGWSRIKRRTLAWMLGTGNGFVETTWDPNGGEILREPVQEPTPTLAVGPDGQPTIQQTMTIVGMREFRSGITSIKARSPFTFIPVGEATDVEEMHACVTGDWMTLGEVKRQWGDRAKDVKTESRTERSTFEEQLEHLVAPSTGQTSGARADSEPGQEGTIIKRYWQLEDSEYPEGRYIIRAGGVTLHNGQHPYPPRVDGKRRLPISHYREIDVAFRFWGKSSIEDMIPDQKGYNRSLSIVMEHHSQFRGKWIAPRGAKLAATSIDDSGDEVVEATPIAGRLPEHAKLEPPQRTIFNMLAIHRRNLEDQSGVREVSRGQNPAGVRSGVAIQRLQESDNTQIATTVMDMRDRDAEVASQALHLAANFMVVPQRLRVVGKNSQLTVVEGFTGDMLRGNTETVAAGPSVPFSLTARKAEVLELAAMGAFRDHETGITDWKQVLEMAEFGHTQEAYGDRHFDEMQAEIENREMEKGVQHVARSYQDHILHFKVHNRYRKRPEYQRRLQRQPLLDLVFQQHIDQHLLFLQPILNPATQPETEGGPRAGRPEDRTRGAGRARMGGPEGAEAGFGLGAEG